MGRKIAKVFMMLALEAAFALIVLAAAASALLAFYILREIIHR